MLAFHAPENSHLGHFYFTSLNTEGESFYQRLCNLVPCCFNDPSKRLPRDFHSLRRLIMVEPV